tara:strand:+ start:451 stop:1008 length:558 start_codon:yes stop_codon:yes gene_type:complete
MPVEMTDQERAEYNKLDRKGKIKYTIDLKTKRAKAMGLEYKHGTQGTSRVGDKIKKKKVSKDLTVPLDLSSEDTQRQMRELIMKYGIHPIEELFRMLAKDTKGRLPDKDKAAICKFLVPYTTPPLKSVDTQRNNDMNVNVTLVNYGDMSQEKLMKEAELVDDSEYAEFDDLGPDEDSQGIVSVHE